jgi:transposase-like protein
MDLIKVFQRFPDHASCIEHLERVRWPHVPACPLCGAVNVARKAENDRIGRWNCRECKSSFNVLSGTIFQKTKIDLQKWFLAISLNLNAKKSLSSHQLARDLDLNHKTAWYMGMRIRRAMVDEGALLSGIVEADEAYVGGKPRKPNRRDDDKPSTRGRDDDKPSTRGRGTDKLPIIGAVERGGRVVAKPSLKVDVAALTSFLNETVDKASLLMTDAWVGYRQMRRHMRHVTVDHSKQYVDGLAHTNTIEGFWALLKRAWYGTHHHYTDEHSIAYVVESCYKYNARNCQGVFEGFLQEAVAV